MLRRLLKKPLQTVRDQPHSDGREQTNSINSDTLTSRLASALSLVITLQLQYIHLIQIENGTSPANRAHE